VTAEEPRTETTPRQSSRRLFFALWPDESMRQAMAQATRKAARRSGGRPVSDGNLHVTLAFLGSVPERRLGELAELAREAAAQLGGDPAARSAEESRLELVFDHLEYWRAAQLLCALPAEPPARMVALARRLQTLLAERGFAPDLKPFRPHVTVVRKVARPGSPGKMAAVTWQFTALALIESRTLPALSPVSATGNASGNAALYSVVESFPLCGGTAESSNAENNSEKA
jgi:RNA 2',3'-cyclic 3'-phosphodiesterase